MIHQYGGHNYSIYLDEETHVLYGYIEVEDEALWARSADTEINRKWWDFMADIMETNPEQQVRSGRLNAGLSSGLNKTFVRFSVEYFQRM